MKALKYKRWGELSMGRMCKCLHLQAVVAFVSTFITCCFLISFLFFSFSFFLALNERIENCPACRY